MIGWTDGDHERILMPGLLANGSLGSTIPVRPRVQPRRLSDPFRTKFADVCFHATDGNLALETRRCRRNVPTGKVDSMYGPTVRRKRNCCDGQTVLHKCIRPHCGAFLLRAIMGICAHPVSLAARPRMGHSGHQTLDAPADGCSIFQFISQTSVGSSLCFVSFLVPT